MLTVLNDLGITFRSTQLRSYSASINGIVVTSSLEAYVSTIRFSVWFGEIELNHSVQGNI